MKTGYAIVVGLVIGMLGGVGYQQMSLGQTVSANSKDIEHLSKGHDELRDMTKEIIALNRELVGLVKVQVELLRDKSQ